MLAVDAEQDDVVEQDAYEEEQRVSEASVVEEAPLFLLAFAAIAGFELVLLLVLDALVERLPGESKSWRLLNVLSVDLLFLYRQLREAQPAKAVDCVVVSDIEVLDFIH